LLGKTASAAIAAASTLAEVWVQQDVALTSASIATRCGLPQPLVAKLLTMLSRRGVIAGTPGRNGGYRLARPPRSIPLFDVVSATGRITHHQLCPFGRRLCADGSQCPLHDHLTKLQQAYDSFLCETTLEVFSNRAMNRGRRKKPEGAQGQLPRARNNR
jgi:Rrf2 family transcriptional regulator, iron-sulfur cluster assembly transcription factor